MKQYEWGVLFFFLGFLLLLSFLSFMNRQTAKELLISSPLDKIIIELCGAVKKPGTYVCEKGISIRSLLEEAGLKTSANRKKIPFKKILISSQKVEIPEVKKAKEKRKKNSLEEK